MVIIQVLAAALLLAALPSAKVKTTPTPSAEVPQQQNLTDDQIREQIETNLGTIDTPITLARWRSLGPRAAPFLEEIAISGKNLPTRRASAIDGLSAVGSEQAPALLTRLSRDEEQPLIVRLTAVRGLGRVEKGGRLIAALRPVLESAKDSRVRGLAADILARRAPSAGCAAVKAQAQREAEDARVHYRRALELCGATPAKNAAPAPDKDR